MRLFILGASGGVGSLLVKAALESGHQITAQTRRAEKLPMRDGVTVAVGDPTNQNYLQRYLQGQDAAAYCLGVDRSGRTTLFSDSTRTLVEALNASGVRRLVAVTGVGAGETRGHGGWLYNRMIFPLFTRNRYADKDRQEAIIRASDLDWTIVRPAPFSSRAGPGPLQVHTVVTPALQLRSVTREEVARFVLQVLENGTYLRQAPFIGHA